MDNYFTLNSTMKEVELKFPQVRSVLHSQFHIGGCSKCGYEPHHNIEQVANQYSKNPHEVLESINKGFENSQNIEISIDNFKNILSSSNNVLIVDVREEWEYNLAHIPNSILLNQFNLNEIISKATNCENVIVVCHHGMRSLKAVVYLQEQGISNAKSLTGGIDAYSVKVDKSIQRY